MRNSRNRHLNRRTHSLGACKTCRRRHVKCDQARPACKTCQIADIVCEGLDHGIQWIDSSHDPDQVPEPKSGPNVRRHLYSEQERVIMSSELVDWAATSSIDQFLSDLDTHAKDLEKPDKRASFIGPFGILNLAEDECSNFNIDKVSKPGDQLASLPVAAEDYQIASHDPLPDLSVAEDFLGNLDNFLQWDDIFNLEPPKAGYVGTPQFTAFEDGFAVPWAIPSKLIGSPNGLPTTSPRHDLPALECTMGNSNALLEANVLLRHFDEHVVPQITWVPMTQKSPLRILNIPAAMITLDQLIYMKQIPIKHANLSNLYAILACASYHLSIHPDFVPDKSSQYWDKITISSHSEAKSHLDLSLKLELKGRTKAKYKDQLMAMLSLTTYAVLTQNQTEARYHLINIEFLIRSRGLVKKRLSRRARLLHHQYTWIRILSESTLVIHNKIPHSTPCEAFWSHHLNSEETNILALRHGSLPQRDGNYELDDFLRIEPNESDSDLKVGDQKDVECNLGDIHLVDSRNYPDEQHSTINGISETWLGLLSQTTRLANVLDQINNKSCTMSAERQLALHRRSNYLEGMICSFTSRRMLPGDGKPKFHMTRALNAALVIYFYRRVRQVNPCILQGYVSQIIQELHRWDAALAQNGLNGPGTAWPAFMGGCEATETNDRGSILQWLDRASVQSGQASYSSAKKVMEEIWKRRDSRTSDADMPPKPGESMSFSWMEYSKEKLQWLILA